MQDLIIIIAGWPSIRLMIIGVVLISSGVFLYRKKHYHDYIKHRSELNDNWLKLQQDRIFAVNKNRSKNHETGDL
ncbi:MAG: hypothetical protein JXK07_10165 [Spirochaetes bacterium]|nr:hypothetical protein [Spirochaetota bacterium]MBN2771237.1 hypothetical protein [Spirochaetota bacterium]